MQCNITILIDDLKIVLQSLYKQPYELVCATISRVQSQYEQLVASSKAPGGQSSPAPTPVVAQNSQAPDPSASTTDQSSTDTSIQSQ